MAAGFTIANFFYILLGAVLILGGISGFQERIIDRRPFFFLGDEQGNKALLYLIVIGAIIIIEQIMDIFGHEL